MRLLDWKFGCFMYPVSQFLLYLVSLSQGRCFFIFSPTTAVHQLQNNTAWNGGAFGWLKGPGTLPLILALLADKKLTAGRDVSRVYLELLARHMGGGVVGGRGGRGTDGKFPYSESLQSLRTKRSISHEHQKSSGLSPISTQRNDNAIMLGYHLA